MTHPSPRRRSRWQFLLLAALFFTPFSGAYLFFFVFPDWQPESRTHYGELIHPARPVGQPPLLDADGAAAAEALLRGRWTLVLRVDGACDDLCRERLYTTRQVRASLNEKRVRVRRVYLAADAAAAGAAHEKLAAEHPDLQFAADPQGVLQAFFGAHAPGSVFLLDPLGNWLMVYPPQAEPAGLRKDLVKLLRLSQIG